MQFKVFGPVGLHFNEARFFFFKGSRQLREIGEGIIGELEHPRGVFEVERMGCGNEGFYKLFFLGYGEEREDPASFVVDDEEDRWMFRFVRHRQRVDVVQRRLIADDGKCRPLRTFRDPDGCGDVAVDSGEAAFAEDRSAEKPREEKLVGVADRHAVG